MSYQDPGPIPKRWLKCPRKASGLFANKFLAFKTPLGKKFNHKVPAQYQFTPSMLLECLKEYKGLKMGLWIDLTNTNRFYDKKEIEATGCKYKKMQCRGHGETPSPEQTREFIEICFDFISQNPLHIIGVHCTHGFNRTGFLLVSYMVEKMDCCVGAAIHEFTKIRPPGIYKGDYLTELFSRHDEVKYTPKPPTLPDWCYEEEECDDEPVAVQQEASDGKPVKVKNRRQPNIKKNAFMEGVPGVVPFQIEDKLQKIRGKVCDMCGWRTGGFPGSQPVSMDLQNIQKLQEQAYRVSWKADGQRYMMLIDGEDQIYFFDRDFCAFKVKNVFFPNYRDLRRHLTNTLLDGEMVIDHVDGQFIPRYLCYDIICYENVNVGKLPFFPDRLDCIERKIVGPRHQAMKDGKINRSREPFSVRLKGFWEVTYAENILGEKFSKTLSHEPDGLIFQPSKAPYKAGQSDDVLKWKPAELNSVDFKLKIEVEDREGMLKKSVGKLYVGGDRFFWNIPLTKELRQLNNKIIECKFENDKWVFMRERTDKSYPNSFNTAQAVCKSIKYPVTTEMLLDYILYKRYHDDAEMMPPPAKRVHR